MAEGPVHTAPRLFSAVQGVTVMTREGRTSRMRVLGISAATLVGVAAAAAGIVGYRARRSHRHEFEAAGPAEHVKPHEESAV